MAFLGGARIAGIRIFEASFFGGPCNFERTAAGSGSGSGWRLRVGGAFRCGRLRVAGRKREASRKH